MTDEGPGVSAADLLADLTRVADRLRSLSQARLVAPLPPYPSRAAAGRALAQTLAIAAQGVEERASPTEPDWRTVPELSEFAVGDQVAVTGRDLVTALAAGELQGPDPVWAPGGRQAASAVVAEVAAAVSEVRRAL